MKPKVDSIHVAEAAQQQPGSGQQDESDGDFNDHKCGAQPRMAAACGAAAPAFFHGGIDVGAEGGEARS